MTADELFPVILAGFEAWCVECKTVTRAAVAIRWVPGASGPGRTLYACPPHAVALGADATPEDVLRIP